MTRPREATATLLMESFEKSKGSGLTAKKLLQLEESPDELRKTSVRDLSIASGVLIDKSRLLQNESTSVVEVRSSFTFEDFNASVRAKQAECRERQEARTIDLERDVTPSATDEGTADEGNE